VVCFTFLSGLFAHHCENVCSHNKVNQLQNYSSLYQYVLLKDICLVDSLFKQVLTRDASWKNTDFYIIHESPNLGEKDNVYLHANFGGIWKKIRKKNLTHTVFSVGFQVGLAEAKCQHILLRLGI